MAIAAIASSQVGNLSAASLTTNDFLKILTTQLTYQDPLKPLDNQEFIAQMAQFTTLDQTRQLNETTAQLLETQSALQSVGLIGKTVQMQLQSGATVSGTVTTVNVSAATPELSLTLPSGQVISGLSIAQIVSVR